MRGKKNVVTSGSGITKRTHEILPFMDGLKKLAEHNRRVTARGKGAFGSLKWLLNTIEDESKAILEKKGIPTDEIWFGAVKRLGYQFDSPVGYAAEQLNRVRILRALIEKGKIVEACKVSFYLGAVVREEEIKYTTTADGPSKGGKKAAKTKKWTPEQRVEIQRALNATSHGEKEIVRKRLGRRFGLSERTISRVITGK